MFLKTQFLKAISYGVPVKFPLWYWCLVVLRFLLTLVPQPGYIHPDEFFQNVEVVAGDILVVENVRTWEFDPKFPVRSMFIPKMIISPPIHFIRLANPYSKYYLNIDLKTPYYLLVLPRLFICLLSVINDYCLYRICVLYGQNFRNRLTILASSYVTLVFCTRSFSNTFEVIFSSLLLYLVAQCMQKSDRIIYHDEFLQDKYKQARSAIERVKLFKLKTHLPEHSLNKVIIISTLVVVGIFNRPTFIGFAFAPVFFWLHRGLGSKVVGFKDFHYRIAVFVLCGIPSLIILITVDSFYYGYLTSADVESMKISFDNWVVTPLNFLRYNTNQKNLTRHGLHPWWLHVLVNLPLLFNVLGILAIIYIALTIIRFTRGQYSKLPRIQSITGLMLFSLVIPIAALSLFPHQEARFIIPVITPLVYLFGNYLFENEADTFTIRKLKKFMRATWYTVNTAMVTFFGFIHQGGLYPYASNLAREVKSTYGTHTYIFNIYTYSMPTFLLQLESTTKTYIDRKTGHPYKLAPTTFLRNYGSVPIDELFIEIDSVLSHAESLLYEYKKKYRFYLASPCALDQKLRERAATYNYIDLVEDYSYYPHFSAEAKPEFPGNRDQYCMESNLVSKNESHVIDLNIFQRISCYVKRYCLRVYAVRVKRHKI